MHVPNLTALAILAATPCVLTAQTPWSGALPVHPHIAPIDSSVTWLYQPNAPMFNLGNNGVWDLGEGLTADSGGALGFDDGTGIQLWDGTSGHVHANPISGNNWNDHTPAASTAIGGGPISPVKRFVGYLRPGAPYANPAADVVDAAFEVFTPATPPTTGQQIVIVLSLHQTLGDYPVQAGPNQNTLFDPRVQYPGDPARRGLLFRNGKIQRPNPNPPRIAGSLPQGSHPYWPICCYIVPRLTQRAQTFLMQRNLQVLEAVKGMFTHPDPQWRPDFGGSPMAALPTSNIPVVVAGGSNGGTQAQMFQALFPDRIHGVMATSFPGNFSRTFYSDQERWRYVASLSGMSGRDGFAYTLLDTLSLNTYLGHVVYRTSAGALEGSDIHNHDITRLFADGEMKRPMFLETQDEDTTGGGETSLPLFTGTPHYDAANTFGALANPNGALSHAPLHYTVIDKACHFGRPYTTPYPPNTTGLIDLDIPLRDVIRFAVASWSTASSLPAPTPIAPTGAETPHDHALDTAPYTGTAWSGSLALNLDPSFPPSGSAFGRTGKHEGLGTWLGFEDSMQIHGNQVYVGSAEGIVSRLQLADPNDPASEFEVVAQSSTALGYGAWGLAVDTGIGDASGTRVIVGTYRKLHVLDANLNLLSTFDPGPALGSAGLAWTRPRRISTSDVFNAHPGKEVVFTTQGGYVVVMQLAGGTLSPISVYHEPGVADLVAGGTSKSSVDQPANSKGIHLLSERGVLSTLSMAPSTNPDPMDPGNANRIIEYSWEVIGAPKDLEYCTYQGIPVLAALYEQAHLETNSVRIFFGDIYHGTAGFGISTNAGGAPNLRYKDVEILYCDTAGEIIVLADNRLLRVDALTGVGAVLDLTGTATGSGVCMHALDVAVGNIDADPEPEIILATEGGHIVWFDESQFPALQPANGVGVYTSVAQVDIPLPYTDTFGTLHTPHTHKALSATWGMTEHMGRLHVVDQAGGRWSMDGAGELAFEHDLVAEVAIGSASIKLHRGSPIYDLRVSGPVPAATSSFDIRAEPMFSGSSTNQPGTLLATKPYVPSNPNGPEGIYGSGTSWVRLYDYYQPNYGDFMAFHFAGDLLLGSTSAQAFWWTSDARGLEYRYRNMIQGAFWDASTVTGTWCSSSTNSVWTNMALRNVSPNTGSDLQALRLIPKASGGGAWVVASTTGGSVQVFDPGAGTNPPVQESRDFGFGGSALAISPSSIASPGAVDVFFASTWDWTKSAGYWSTSPYAEPMSSRLAWLRVDPTSGSLGEVLHIDLAALGLPWTPYGACGIAVGELDPSNAVPEVVVGTLAGDLLVFEPQVGGGGLTLLYATRIEGSVGAFNGLLIEDLDGNPGNELYVAGSFGLRRFI